jgi:hypothetical protein
VATTSTYDEYFSIQDMGNNRSEKYIVDLTIYFEVHNMQEEIAMLLSSKNRSHQYPDYQNSYEFRVSNVYTTIYRETLRMSNHYSSTFNFFPSKIFSLRIRINRKGYIVITIDDVPKPILALYDEKVPLEPNFVSFGSRMNAYPVRAYFGCKPSPSEPTTMADSDFDDNRCPCKPQKCEVVVRACSDNSEDLLNNEAEKQKYFFYFNVYMSKLKGNKNLLNGNDIGDTNGNTIKDNAVKK